MNALLRRALCIAAATIVLPSASAAPVLFSGSGADTASIQSVVDDFREALGDPNNGVLAGSQPAGRREISWDGGGAGAPAATFGIPMENFANRGSVFTTPGTGFEISGQPTPEFGDINPTYPDIFTTFSTPRLFAPLGSNITDVLFTVPGTTAVPAVSTGFGAVFTDVDLAATSSLEFFDPFGLSLGSFFAPVFNGGLSFLGVTFDSAIVSRVRVTTGNTALGPNDSSTADIVALDDFIFGEPRVAAVAEPATLALAAIALAGMAFWLRARRRPLPGHG